MFQSDFSRHQSTYVLLTANFECILHISFETVLKATNDMKKHLIEYKNLMNVKLSLEKEIDVYRSLLEGNHKTLFPKTQFRLHQFW